MSGRGAGGGDVKRKEPILDLSKYLNQSITVEFTGGRKGEHSSVSVSDRRS